MPTLSLPTARSEYAKARAFIEDRCNSLLEDRKREMIESEAKGEKYIERDDVISFLLNQNDVRPSGEPRAWELSGKVENLKPAALRCRFLFFFFFAPFSCALSL